MKLLLNLRLLFTAVILLLPTFSMSDVFTRGVFQLSSGQVENQYEFIAQYPASKKSEDLIKWPEGCLPVQTNHYNSIEFLIQTYLIECDVPLKSGDIITVPYQVDSAIFEVQLGSWQSRTIATGLKAGFQLVLQTDETTEKVLLDIATEYSFQGTVHIWFGWDHLAFVFCLCILAVGFRQLLWTITAFTIGHSVSMALSFFKLVNIPIPPVEAIIALSIILIARVAWLQMNHSDKAIESPRFRALIVVVLFGLVHGLGFASALENIGVAVNERIPALIFFNLGVEVGQIAFVAIIFAIMALLRKVQKADIMARIALVCVGSAGSFWTIERIASFNW